jgi:hypothetical protein
MTPIKEVEEDMETMARYSKGPNKPGVKRTWNGPSVSPNRTPRRSVGLFSPGVSPGAVYGGLENTPRKSINGSANKSIQRYSPTPTRLSRISATFRSPLKETTKNLNNKDN